MGTSFAARALVTEKYAGLQPVERRMILITGTDAQATDQAAMLLFDAGHVPMMSEWVAFPLIAVAHPKGTRREAAMEGFMQPVADRLLDRCDAVLRLPGTTPASDALVAAALARGLRVYFSAQDAIDG